ncbi:MAG: PEP-CTERM sorting domain-containing protein [Planctomycetota bacterium]|nr:PEP-CTERM sorting domain-containing protein [Planctomycetota bacterium]
MSVDGAVHASFGATQHLAALNLATGESQLTPGGAKVLVTRGLGIDPAAARLDLTDNDMIVHYTGGTPHLPSAELESIKAWIAAGYDWMSWAGNGIVSSAAAPDPITYGLGYAQNDMLFLPYDVFSGEPVDSSTILVKFTYNGDVNLDGCVDDNDVTFFNLFYDGGIIHATDADATLDLVSLTGNTGGGELRVDDKALLTIRSSFMNAGFIYLGGPGAVLSATSITNSGTIQGAGRLAAPLTNNGSVVADAGMLRFALGLSNGPAGRIDVDSGATVLAAAGLTPNAGAIILRGGTFDNSSYALTNGGTITGHGTLRTGGLTNNAGKNVGVGDGDLDVRGSVTNNGTVNTQAGCTTTFYNRVNGNGSFPGTGTVVFLDGFSPGLSPGEVAFGGDVRLAAGSLIMELAGLARGSQYDALDVGGTLALGGTLDVRLLDGYMPLYGDTFDLLNWGGVAGEFDAVSLPALAGGLAWDASALYADGSLAVVPEPATLALVALGGLALLGRRRVAPPTDRP